MKRKFILSILLFTAIILFGCCTNVYATARIGNQDIQVPADGETLSSSVYGGTLTITNNSDKYTVTMENIAVNEGTDLGGGLKAGLYFDSATNGLDLIIKGKVSIGASDNYMTYAVMTSGGIKLSGFNNDAKLTVYGGTGVLGSGVEINSLKLDAFSNKKTDMFASIFSMGTINIKDSYVYCDSKNDAAIYAFGSGSDLKIDNSTVITKIADGAMIGNIAAENDIIFDETNTGVTAKIGDSEITPVIEKVDRNGYLVYTVNDSSHNMATYVEVKNKKIELVKEDSSVEKYINVKEALDNAETGDKLKIKEDSNVNLDLEVPEDVEVIVESGNKLSAKNLKVNGKLTLESNAEVKVMDLNGSGEVSVRGNTTKLLAKTLSNTLKIVAGTGYEPKAGDVIITLNADGAGDGASNPETDANKLKDNLVLADEFGDLITKVVLNGNEYQVQLAVIEQQNQNPNEINPGDNNNNNNNENQTTDVENKTEGKDETPKTGNNIDYAVASLVVIMIATLGIVYVKKI